MVDLVGEDDLQALGRILDGDGRPWLKLNAGVCGGGDAGRYSCGRGTIYSDFSFSRRASRETSRWFGLVVPLEARRPAEEEKSRWGPPGVRLSGARISGARLSEGRMSGPRVSEYTECGELA